MNNQIRRIEALEVTMNPAPIRRWHRVLQQPGETRNASIAAYEAENGSVGANDGVVLRRIVTV